MDKKLLEQKIALWKKQEAALQKQLEDTLHRKGTAAQEGDLRENAAYQMAQEEAEVISARLGNIQRMIMELEKGGV